MAGFAPFPGVLETTAMQIYHRTPNEWDDWFQRSSTDTKRITQT
jgi:hypothetical protein